MKNNTNRIKLSFTFLIDIFKHSKGDITTIQKKQLNQFINHTDGTLKEQLSDLYKKITTEEISSCMDISSSLDNIYSDFFQQALNTDSLEENTLINSEKDIVETQHINDKQTSSSNVLSSSSRQPLAPEVNSNNQNNICTKSELEFIRDDGSILKIQPVSSCDSIYYFNFNKYQITQKFPALGNFTVTNFIYSSISMDLLINSDSYRNKIEQSLSPQNIYQAATEHYGFLHSGNPAFNSSSQEILNYTEDICRTECLNNRPPFSEKNDILRRLIPITILTTPYGIVTQLEYFTSGINSNNSNLKYIFTNIDYKKLYNDKNYQNFILYQISKSEQTLKNPNINSVYFGIDYNDITDTYHTFTDDIQSKMINTYIDYVSNNQLFLNNKHTSNNFSR